MMLRVQRERLEEDLGDAPGEFLARYGLTEERFATAAPDAVVMHPGPINRGVEIEGSLADHPTRSLIVRQVEMGVAVRMACLDLLTAERHRLGLSAKRTGPARRPRRRGRSRRGPARFSEFAEAALLRRSLSKPLTDRR